MNNFYKDANPYGGNPFDFNLFTLPDGQTEPINMEVTFNDWLKTLNCIVENRFYKNVLRDDGARGESNTFGQMISNCRYLLCVPGGFYGLEAYWKKDDDGSRTFAGFILHDIGSTLPILGKDFNFKFCSFHVMGNGDETTLFLAVREMDDGEEGKYHYLYLNESSLDETYGFTEIDSVVVD